MKDLVWASAGAWAEAIRQRRLSAVEALEICLSRIGRYNPALNAVITLEEGSRRRAREADEALAGGRVWGPLHGVPVVLKDCFETAGLRTTCGFPPLAEYIPAADATAAARLRAAGAVLLGKTNVPLLAMDWQTDNPLFGRTNNPWNPERTPGGSTGGGATAVAAGLVPLEVGSDIGGSVRVPAHFCGLYSFKPTDHRVPVSGHIPELPGAPRAIRHMQHVGPLARSLDDLELALRILAGPDGRDMEVPPLPLTPAPPRSLSDLRIAWTADFGGLGVSRDTAAALETFVRSLEAAGCRLEQRSPAGFDFTAAWEVWGEIVWFEMGASYPPELKADIEAKFGLKPGSDVPIERGLARAIPGSTRDYAASLTRRDALIVALEKFLVEWEALLCPVSMTPAFPHWPTGAPMPVEGREVPYFMVCSGYTTPFNLTGHPVVVLPIGRSAEGLPIGVQVVGRRWQEMALLAVARELAKVAGPFQPPPGYED